MLDDRARLRLVADLYGNDAMIELLRRWPTRTHVVRIAGINTDQHRINAYDPEHRAHEVCLVFAVAVRLCKNFGRGMWNIAPASAHTSLNRNISNVLNVAR